VAKKTEYKLKEVKALAWKALNGEDSVLIRGNALDRASDDFGFDTNDILNTLKNLSGNHFNKRMSSEKVPGVMLDVYKTCHLGEEIYTHFYIRKSGGKDILVINSFHEP